MCERVTSRIMNQETESRRGDKWCDDEGKEEQMEVKQEDGVWGRMSGGSEGGVWGGKWQCRAASRFLCNGVAVSHWRVIDCCDTTMTVAMCGLQWTMRRERGGFLEGWNIERIWLECSQRLILVRRAGVWVWMCGVCVCGKRGEEERERQRVCWVWPASLSSVKSRATGAPLQPCHYRISSSTGGIWRGGRGRGGQQWTPVLINVRLHWAAQNTMEAGPSVKHPCVNFNIKGLFWRFPPISGRLSSHAGRTVGRNVRRLSWGFLRVDMYVPHNQQYRCW